MKRIVVCVKYVPDATADRRFEADNTVDRVGVDGLLSELDEYAVEQALQIKEKSDGDTEVTVRYRRPGPGHGRDPQVVADGCRQGRPRIDDAIAGSDAPATSLVLAKAIEKLAGAPGTWWSAEWPPPTPG